MCKKVFLSLMVEKLSSGGGVVVSTNSMESTRTVVVDKRGNATLRATNNSARVDWLE